MANSKELKLEYPCDWEYKTILESHHDAKEIIKNLLSRDHKIKESNSSKKGKYQTHIVTTQVQSDDDRKALFEELKNHKSIKFVL